MNSIPNFIRSHGSHLTLYTSLLFYLVYRRVGLARQYEKPRILLAHSPICSMPIWCKEKPRLYCVTVSSNFLPKDWRPSHGLVKARLTDLHFYFHERYTTAVTAASALITAKSPTLFGQLGVADEPLMKGPDPTLEEVGRAHGMYGLVSMEEFSIIMALSFSFSKGEIKGSSLSMVSPSPIMHSLREMSIVRGTGKFRLARGVAIARTVVNGVDNAIVDYHVKAIHSIDFCTQ